MLETNYKSPLRLIENEWESLAPSEKSVCLNYAKQLAGKNGPNNKMIMAINKIHLNHEDFHMGCIPCSQLLLNDSDFLPGPA